jgi:hypothetical protein
VVCLPMHRLTATAALCLLICINIAFWLKYGIKCLVIRGNGKGYGMNDTCSVRDFRAAGW